MGSAHAFKDEHELHSKNPVTNKKKKTGLILALIGSLISLAIFDVGRIVLEESTWGE